MIQNDKSLPQYVLKLKENAKEEKRQIEILKAFLKQMKSAYNEDLVQYNIISSNIIQQELVFEKQSKQITKIQYKQLHIQSLINNAFIHSLKESIKSITCDANRILLLCFGFPDGIDSSIQLPINNPNQLIEMLEYTEPLLEDLFIKSNSSFIYLKEQITRLKSSNNTFGHQINQIINYISLIQDKVTINNEKSRVLSQHDLLNKDKDKCFVCLKEKEKEINNKYGLYKLKCGYIKRIGNTVKQYKEYELLGKNYSLYNEMTAQIALLVSTKVDCFENSNENNFCIQSKYEDTQSEGVSCSFINDYSVNEDLMPLKQENRMIFNGTEVISLSPIGDKEGKNSLNNSSLNKKKQNWFHKKTNNENNNVHNIQQDKASSGGNGEPSQQISQMIDETSRYDKQIKSTNTLGEGIVINSIQNLNSNNKSEPDPQVVRGKQNKKATYSLKLEQPVNSGGCCVSCT